MSNDPGKGGGEEEGFYPSNPLTQLIIPLTTEKSLDVLVIFIYFDTDFVSSSILWNK